MCSADNPDVYKRQSHRKEDFKVYLLHEETIHYQKMLAVYAYLVPTSYNMKEKQSNIRKFL